MNRIRVAHIITGLGTGGAETMLLKLLGEMDRDLYEPLVLSLMDSSGQPIWKAITQLGVPTGTLNLRRSFPNPLSLGKLKREACLCA